MNYLLRYEPIRALLKYEPITNITAIEPISHEKFKRDIFTHIEILVKKRKMNNKTESHIRERCKLIKCLLCLDTKHLWVPRNIITTLDNQGRYEILNCYNCSDGAFSNYSDTNFIIENGVRMFQYNSPCFETTIHQLEALDDSIPLWNLCKDKTLTRNVREISATIDLNKLTVQISNLIQSHLGNVASIHNFIKTFDGELKYLYFNEHSKNECYELIEDTEGKIYIMMEMEKQIVNSDFSCGVVSFSGSAKEYLFHIRYTISVPRNKLAEKKCDEWFNSRVTKIMSTKLDRRSTCL